MFPPPSGATSPQLRLIFICFLAPVSILPLRDSLANTHHHPGMYSGPSINTALVQALEYTVCTYKISHPMSKQSSPLLDDITTTSSPPDQFSSIHIATNKTTSAY
ncbi:hypothetical protein IFR04_004188 [Cadophora malorum]|uniref:Uncharacterized protein n=1 Tax=Cadophora malorum TaxID=108018 RepID=A0A8H7WDB3_9HELO|nr:hypothetical protein IFR04_004188 [Cadophora malorum]